MTSLLPLPEALPQAALRLAETLKAKGFDALFVGGAVRDILRGAPAKDIDLATNATPQEVRAIFKRTFVVGTGERHGTIGVMGEDNIGYEVTTFREDIDTDGRHATVRFAKDIETDLARRDFTMNAMALRPQGPAHVEIIDPFGGQADLQNNILRTVGRPEDRFKEDYLRILRLYRFAARLGAALDMAARQAAKALSPGLAGLSRERIQAELWKILGDTVVPGRLSQTFQMMHEDGILTLVMPELVPEKLPAQLLAAEALLSEAPLQDSSKRTLFRLAMFVEHLSPALLKKMAERLTMSNDDLSQVTELVVALPRLRQCLATPTPETFRRTQASLKHFSLEECASWLVALEGAALAPSEGSRFLCQVEAAMREAHESGYPLKPSDLALNGQQLMSLLNITPGPNVGRIIQGLFEHVLAHPTDNTEALLAPLAQALLARLKANSPRAKR